MCSIYHAERQALRVADGPSFPGEFCAFPWVIRPRGISVWHRSCSTMLILRSSAVRWKKNPGEENPSVRWIFFPLRFVRRRLPAATRNISTLGQSCEEISLLKYSLGLIKYTVVIENFYICKSSFREVSSYVKQSMKIKGRCDGD